MRPLVGLNSLGFKPKKTKEPKQCALCPFRGLRGNAKYCAPCGVEVAMQNKVRYDRRVKYGN